MQLPITLFSYKIVYKVATKYIPYQLVYILYPLMPTKYVLIVLNGDHTSIDHVKVHTSRLLDLKKLQINRL